MSGPHRIDCANFSVSDCWLPRCILPGYSSECWTGLPIAVSWKLWSLCISIMRYQVHFRLPAHPAHLCQNILTGLECPDELFVVWLQVHLGRLVQLLWNWHMPRMLPVVTVFANSAPSLLPQTRETNFSTQMTWSSHPFIKLASYSGTGSLETFLTKFRNLACYLCWMETDKFSIPS